MKFATTSSNNYIADIKVYRAGQSQTAREPYYSDERTYGNNETVTIPLRVGNYDIFYNIIEGSSGKTVSSSSLSNIEVLEDTSTETFTPIVCLCKQVIKYRLGPVSVAVNIAKTLIVLLSLRH